MNISIIGTGYVGLVTGACLADRGHTVTCVDLDPRRVAALNAGVTPIFEAGLAELLRANVPHRLRATTNLAEAVQGTDLTFISVGTPFDGHTIDLTAVTEAARQIGAVLRTKPGYHVVTIKSTVVPGTTDQAVIPVLELASGRKAGPDFGVGMNPEFLSEGEAVRDFMHPDRIVLGGIDARTIAQLEEVYRPFPDAPRIHTNTRTAELIKYTSNALLATLISFSNEIANLASAMGEIDALEVMKGLHLSQYFRARGADELPSITSFLQPGCGFGGSCLPKDVKALIAHGRGYGEPLRLLQAVMEVNEQQPARLVRLLDRRWPDLHNVRIAVLGLAFKPGTNDVRESPAFPVVRALLSRHADVAAYDPAATADFQRQLPDRRIRYCASLTEALDGAAAVVVVTPWPEFADLPTRLRALDPEPLLVDGRRTFTPESVAHYAGIGV
jgi:UDPglucose 6-dehydrogenase